MLPQVDIKFDSESSGIVWSLLETINLLISIQNVEKWSQHEEEREDKAAGRGVEEDAEAVPAEGDVLPGEGGGGAAGPLWELWWPAV